MKNLQDNDVLTVGVFREVVQALDVKMTDGFDVVNKRIDGVELRMNEGFASVNTRIDGIESKMGDGFTALDSKVDMVDKASEHRDRALSAQIQHLAFTKADWNDIV